MVLFNPFNRLINDSNSYFTSSSTVKRSYIKDGQRIVEEKHIYTDKDGKLKEDKKVRKTPVNMKYRIENR